MSRLAEFGEGQDERTAMYNPGELEDRTYRKRLIWTRRDYNQIKDQKPSIHLMASKMEFETDGSTRPGQKLEWLQWGTPYISPERVNELTARYMKEFPGLPSPQFRPFSVIVSSLPYLRKQDSTSKNFQEYVVNTFLRTIGNFVFVKHNGVLVLFITYLTEPNQYQTKSVIKFQSIYPVIAYEWAHETARSRTVLGMGYNVSSEALGSRYYNRHPDHRQIAGAYEMSLKMLEIFKRKKKNNRFVVLYVGAGAKLVVQDPFTDDWKTKTEHHNRFMVQQGGIVVCNTMNLSMVIPVAITDEKLRGSGIFRLKFYPWNEFCEKGYIKPVKEGAELPPDCNQLVLFLSGVDSDRNAAVWYLSLERHYTNTDRYVASLTVPLSLKNPTMIAAVSIGNEGIAEVEARVQYEQLHDSVLTNHDIEFCKPNNQMVERILNIENNRSYVIDYVPTLEKQLDQSLQETLIHNQNATPENKKRVGMGLLRKAIPPIFDPPSIIEGNDRSFMDRINSRPAPPPMYPPMYDKSSQKTYFLPSKEVQIDDVEGSAEWWGEGPEVYLKYNNQKFEYSKKTFPEFHYKRLTAKDDQNYKTKTGAFDPGSELYRIGVDGWMWMKMNDTKLYDQTMTYLKAYGDKDVKEFTLEVEEFPSLSQQVQAPPPPAVAPQPPAKEASLPAAGTSAAGASKPPEELESDLIADRKARRQDRQGFLESVKQSEDEKAQNEDEEKKKREEAEKKKKEEAEKKKKEDEETKKKKKGQTAKEKKKAKNKAFEEKQSKPKR